MQREARASPRPAAGGAVAAGRGSPTGFQAGGGNPRAQGAIPGEARLGTQSRHQPGGPPGHTPPVRADARGFHNPWERTPASTESQGDLLTNRGNSQSGHFHIRAARGHRAWLVQVAGTGEARGLGGHVQAGCRRGRLAVVHAGTGVRRHHRAAAGSPAPGRCPRTRPAQPHSQPGRRGQGEQGGPPCLLTEGGAWLWHSPDARCMRGLEGGTTPNSMQ